jgi:hypothetical protein
MAALEALAQVHPGVTRFETFLAALDPVEACDGDGRQVSASGWHHQLTRERRLEEDMVLDAGRNQPKLGCQVLIHP